MGEGKPSQLTMNDLVSGGIETAAVAARASSTTKHVQEVVEIVLMWISKRLNGFMGNVCQKCLTVSLLFCIARSLTLS